MRIIKKGDANEVQCPSCNSLLEFSPNDITRNSIGRDEEGDEIFSYCTKCMVCSYTISLTNITPAMRSEVARINKIRDALDYDDM